ncbi:MAG: hypothetical protein JXR61_05520 [Prolixibacteraceae bacterium]|nr:hypothetical protein [Prolixibacteraceae bacterium]
MNRFLIAGIAAILLLANSCEIEVPPRYFEVDGHSHKLNVAYMDDWRTDEYDYSLRWWAVSFRSEETLPSNFITFQIGSFFNETDIISDGVYEYDYFGGKGFFSDIAIGYDIEYDYKGQPSGYKLDDEIADFSGTISVDKEGSSYYFVFDLEVVYNDVTYKIDGEYEGRLTIDSYLIDLEDY